MINLIKQKGYVCVCVCVCLHIRNIMNTKDSERQTLGSRAEANITLNEELLAIIY